LTGYNNQPAAEKKSDRPNLMPFASVGEPEGKQREAGRGKKEKKEGKRITAPPVN